MTGAGVTWELSPAVASHSTVVNLGLIQICEELSSISGQFEAVIVDSSGLGGVFIFKLDIELGC